MYIQGSSYSLGFDDKAQILLWNDICILLINLDCKQDGDDSWP